MSSCWLTSIPWYQDGVWTAMILGPEVGLSIREGYQEQVAAMYCPHFPHFPPLPTIWFADKPSGKLPNIIVTSATKGRWRWCVHPDLSVWLFVCLWTGYIKRLWTNLNEVIRFSVKIRIRKFLNFQSDFSPLTDRSKTIYRRYLKNLWKDLDELWGMSWVGERRRLLQFGGPDPDAGHKISGIQNVIYLAWQRDARHRVPF